jgi:hypothetical protein
MYSLMVYIHAPGVKYFIIITIINSANMLEAQTAPAQTLVAMSHVVALEAAFLPVHPSQCSSSKVRKGLCARSAVAQLPPEME